MTEIVVAGGFGSGRNQMNHVAESIGTAFGEKATGKSYSDAESDLESFAHTIDASHAYSHSGGFLLIYRSIVLGARPKEVTAIAAPVPEQIKRLMVRGAFIGVGFGQKIVDELEQKFEDPRELVRHPFVNFAKRLPELSRFDSLAAAADIADRGIPVTLAYMKQDGLFRLDTEDVTAGVEKARSFGACVVSIEGKHCEFTHRPLDVLGRIASASTFDCQQSQANSATLHYRQLITESYAQWSQRRDHQMARG